LPPDVTDTTNSIPGVCLSVRPFVRFKLHLRDGRTDGQSVRLLDGGWHYATGGATN